MGNGKVPLFPVAQVMPIMMPTTTMTPTRHTDLFEKLWNIGHLLLFASLGR